MPPAPRHAFLLANPFARAGDGPLDAILATLAAGGITATPHSWPGRDQIGDLIRAQATRYDLAIIGGGDGTLNGAAAALAQTRLPLGILPLGTANDFARTLSIPSDPVAAARVICTSVPRPVDLGDVNGHPFLNVASIGFSADLARELTTRAKKRFGVAGYGLVAARLIAQSRLFTAYVEHDETVETVRTLQVSVGNGHYYGGGLAIAADASAEDARLDFYSLGVRTWWRLLPLLPALRHGTQGSWPDVRAFRTAAVVVRTRKPRAVNTDGELVTFTPATFTVRPGALLVHAPHVPAPPVPAPDPRRYSARPVTPARF